MLFEGKAISVNNKTKTYNRRHKLPKHFFYPYKKKIGIMGGSFDPIHIGHLHIAEKAKITAQLDEIWWIICVQNPLKKNKPMNDFKNRHKSAIEFAKYKWIRVLDIDHRNNFSYTFETIMYLRSKMKNSSIYWIMGSDNLVSFSKWKKFELIVKYTHILIMNRPKYSFNALSLHCKNFLKRQNRKRNPKFLNQKHSTYWSFIFETRNSFSSRLIRKELKNTYLAEN